jgi:hypothetical protein
MIGVDGGNMQGHCVFGLCAVELGIGGVDGLGAASKAGEAA